MRTYAHARTYSACGLHTEESRRIHINKNGYSQRLELWVTWILHFSFYWFSTVLQGTCIIWITHTKALIVIYIYIKKRFWVLEKTSGRTLRPGIFEDTLSTALEEAPGPRTPPRRGPYLRSLRPLFAISAQAALLCLLIRWGLSQMERELASGVCVEKEITWKPNTFSGSWQWVTYQHSDLWKEKGPQNTRNVWPLISLPLTQAG